MEEGSYREQTEHSTYVSLLYHNCCKYDTVHDMCSVIEHEDGLYGRAHTDEDVRLCVGNP